VTGVGGGHDIDLRDYAAAGRHAGHPGRHRLRPRRLTTPRRRAAGYESVGVLTRAVEGPSPGRSGLRPVEPLPVIAAPRAPPAPIRSDLVASGIMRRWSGRRVPA
jgi:hypothetical protein